MRGAFLAGAMLAGAFVACTRSADIRDEPDASFLEKIPPTALGEPQPVDAPLGPPDHPACSDRSDPACYGDLDFPCAFDTWAATVASACQKSTGCKANGDLEIELGADGCVAEIRMNKPNLLFVQCLAAAMGSVRCPCSSAPVLELFLGIANDGCKP